MGESAIILDVTDGVCFNETENKSLSLLKCVCGKQWDFQEPLVIGNNLSNVGKCPDCNREFYYEIIIYQILKRY